MSTDLLLRYIACHRGKENVARRAAIAAHPTHYRQITKGRLKGCWRREVGSNLRAVFKFGRGFALEFHVVIRPGFPECLATRED